MSNTCTDHQERDLSCEACCVFTADELTFASDGRCLCGAGLAYPKEHRLAREISAWVCSAVLLGEVKEKVVHAQAFGPRPTSGHQAYDFRFYDIESDDQPSRLGRTTRRPDQGHSEIRSRLECKRCGTVWYSPWVLPSSRDPWNGGPCTGCGQPSRGPHGESLYEDVETRCESRVVMT